MATIGYQPPIAQVPASLGFSDSIISGIPVNSHVNEADFVVLSAGGLQTAAANFSAALVGIAQHDSNAAFDQITTGLQGVFGFNQATGGGLMPQQSGQLLVAAVGPPIIVEINLSATTGWLTGGAQQANFGTGVGINKDATTGFFYADQTLANIVAHLVGKPIGPNRGNPGDLGARVYIAFDVASAFVGGIVAGH